MTQEASTPTDAQRGKPQVTLSHVGHSFQAGHLLFEDLSTTLTVDHVYAVTGPSGSGKSTLLGILAGWIAPTQGSVTRTNLRRVQWVFQNPHGVAGRTALDHVALPFIARGFTRQQAQRQASQLLAEFGLSGVANSAFGALSGGESGRLMLARGIAAAPDLLLVDEPTAQLDRTTAGEVNRSLHALAGRGVIVVIATHDLQTALMCTDVINLGDMSHREPAMALTEGQSQLMGENERPAQASAGVESGGIAHPVAVKWREALREAWRNLATGTSHALALAVALFALAAVLGGLDALAVRTIVDDAAQFRDRGGATWVLQAPGLVNAAACDALVGAGDVVAAGALRQQADGLVTTTLPRNPIPLFSVTPGFDKIIGVEAPDSGAGLWVSAAVSSRYSVEPAGSLATPAGLARIDGVFSYPDDGRDTRLNFAALAPTPPTNQPFDECWLTIWPTDDSSMALARTALMPTADQSAISQIRYQQLNPTLASTFDGLTTFLNRPSRFASVVALAIGTGLGFVAVWGRRLEYVSALHCGLPKAFLLLEIMVETIFWAACAAIMAAPFMLFIASRARADVATVAAVGVKPLLAALCGVPIGAFMRTLAFREHHLFRLFKNR